MNFAKTKQQSFQAPADDILPTIPRDRYLL